MNTPQTIVVALLAAFVPSLAYTMLIWWLDRHEREPVRLMFIAFGWGALPAILLSVGLEAVLGRPFAQIEPVLLQNVATTSLLAPVIEEVAKGIALLLLFLLARGEFDSVLDGIVYGAVIGFGFAMTENALYFVEVLSRGQIERFTSVVLLRSLILGLNHAFYTAIIGAGFGLAAEASNLRPLYRWSLPLMSLLLAIGFHAIHNLGIMLSGSSTLALLIAFAANWSGVALLVVIILMSWQRERSWIETELSGEVGTVLSPADYSAAAAYGRRVSGWWDAWRTGGWQEARRQGRYQDLLTRLAVLKHRARRGDGSPELQRQIEAVRADILAVQSRTLSR